jgi:DNA-directed RNA polymerase subunit L
MSAAPSTKPKTFAERQAAARAAAASAAPGTRLAVAKPGPAALESIFKSVNRSGPNVLKFQLAPTHVSYANTLRRTMITEVETVAFRADILADGRTSDVLITKNSTPMSNEMLAHRIGLLPIHIRDPLNWKPELYTFKMNISNDTATLRDVYAEDIEVLKDRGAEEEPLKVPSREFFHPDPITGSTALLAVLKGRIGTQEPESISFTAKATVGKGRENARFMPVTARCAYGYTLDESPERKKEIFVKWLREAKKVSPTELEADSAKKAAFEREFETMEVQRCYKVDERGEPYSFDFIVESVGVLDPAQIVRRAIDILQEKMLQYASIDSGDLPGNLKVVPTEARGPLFDFVFQGEDHTLGNLLQTWMDQNQIDSEIITFAGYKVPHPLRDEMLLRVGVADGKDSSARAAVAAAARGCAQMFKEWSAAWAATAAS